jgi:hypothetical protein
VDVCRKTECAIQQLHGLYQSIYACIVLEQVKRSKEEVASTVRKVLAEEGDCYDKQKQCDQIEQGILRVNCVSCVSLALTLTLVVVLVHVFTRQNSVFARPKAIIKSNSSDRCLSMQTKCVFQ